MSETKSTPTLAEGQKIMPGANGPVVEQMQKALGVKVTGVHKGESVDKVNELRAARDLPQNGAYFAGLENEPTPIKKAAAKKADGDDGPAAA